MAEIDEAGLLKEFYKLATIEGDSVLGSAERNALSNSLASYTTLLRHLSGEELRKEIEATTYASLKIDELLKKFTQKGIDKDIAQKTLIKICQALAKRSNFNHQNRIFTQDSMDQRIASEHRIRLAKLSKLAAGVEEDLRNMEDNCILKLAYLSAKAEGKQIGKKINELDKKIKHFFDEHSKKVEEVEKLLKEGLKEIKGGNKGYA